MSRPLICFIAFLIAIASSQSLDAAGEARVLRAGAAKADITPPLGEKIIGSFRPYPAERIHDRMHARCLVLDDGKTRIAFVICDNLGIVREVYDEARELIAKETDFPVKNILMAATHTHSGTRARMPKYRPLVVRGIADAVNRANANLEPAKIGWGGVDEPSEVFNRRWHVTDPKLLKNPFGGQDTVRMNPPWGNPALVKPAGPIDPEISFVSVQSKSGRPIALLANYSLHYVGRVNKGDISADYFGVFSKLMEDHFTEMREAEHPFVGMLSNGTSGDINNNNYGGKYVRREPYEKIELVAKLVAKRVKEAHKKIEFHDWVPIGSATHELTLKARKPDEKMRKHFKKVLALPEGETLNHRYERSYAQRVQNLLDGPDTITVPLQAVRIGDLGIAAIPFETFAEIGLEIKEKAPFGDAFTIELANSSHGYLPTPAQHKLGGYETWMGTNRVELEASEKITKVIFELMAELKN